MEERGKGGKRKDRGKGGGVEEGYGIEGRLQYSFSP